MAYALMMFKRGAYWTYPGFLLRTASKLEIGENYILRQIFLRAGLPGGENAAYLITLIVLLIISAFIMTRKNTSEIIKTAKMTTRTAILLAVIFIWSFISLSNVSTFIYFQY
jgi:alginate O-acetyltransferase complex protein AlgI